MARPLTHDVYTRAELLLRSHSQRAVAALIGTSRSQLWMMKRRGWKVPSRLRQRPNDFAIQCRHMSSEELTRHYRTSTRSVARWRRELGQ